MKLRFIAAVAGLALVAGALLPSLGAARRAPDQALVAVADLPFDGAAQAVVVRTAHGAQQDLIVVNPSSDRVAALGGAISLLHKMRSQEAVPGETRIAIVQHTRSAKAGNTPMKRKLRAIVSRAASGERRQLGQFGQGGVVAIPSIRVMQKAAQAGG